MLAGAALTLALHLALLGIFEQASTSLRSPLAQPQPGPVFLLRQLPSSPAQGQALLSAQNVNPAVQESKEIQAQAAPAWIDPQAHINSENNEPAEAEPQPTQDSVDRPALPVTEPDLSQALDLSNTGAPIRLRLRIAADGQVTSAEVVECAEADTEFAQAVAQALLHTPHIPARKDGQDVASTKEIWLEFPTALVRRLH
jgi:hypothetical protein